MRLINSFAASAFVLVGALGAQAAEFKSPAYIGQLDRSAFVTTADIVSAPTIELVGQAVKMSNSLAQVDPGPGNLALVWQTGILNNASIEQTGRGNVGLIRQIGPANSALIQQSGFGHRAMVFQQGRGNIAIIRQR